MSINLSSSEVSSTRWIVRPCHSFHMPDRIMLFSVRKRPYLIYSYRLLKFNCDSVGEGMVHVCYVLFLFVFSS